MMMIFFFSKVEVVVVLFCNSIFFCVFVLMCGDNFMDWYLLGGKFEEGEMYCVVVV